MRALRRPARLVGAALLLVVAAAGPVRGGEAGVDLLEAVRRRLHEELEGSAWLVDEAARRLRARAQQAADGAAERQVAFQLLTLVPASHVALYDTWSKDHLLGHLRGERQPTVGLDLARIGGHFHVAHVLAGGPAARAGIVRGEEVVAIDGVPVAASPRLTARHDDAALADPPAHLLRVAVDEALVLDVRREPAGPVRSVRIVAALASAVEADRHAARLVEVEGRRVAVVPLAYMYARDTTRLLREAFLERFVDADAFVLDLRGRGGSPIALLAAVAFLRDESTTGGRPLVALADDGTRSAKELLILRLREAGRVRVVGERTAGAVRPARFHAVGPDTWLLCPRGPLRDARGGIELVGLAPDVAVSDTLPFCAGDDPILEAGLAEAVRMLGEHAAERGDGGGP